MFLADKVFLNGVLYTLKSAGDTARAMAVRDGKILQVGAEEEIRKIPAKETIDLGGGTVIPAFSNSHCHLAEMVEGLYKVDLSDTKSINDIIDKMKAALPGVKPGQWLQGYQLRQRNLAEQRLPDRYDLDKVSAEVPIFLSSYGLHQFMLNSPALRITGLKKGFDKPGSELLLTDRDGEPTGLLSEHRLLPYVWPFKPKSGIGDKEEQKEALRKHLLCLAREGYTTLHTFDGFDGSVLNDLNLYQELAGENKLTMRVIFNRERCMNNPLGAISGLGNEWVKFGAFKIFTDGSFSERTSFLLEDYEGRPGDRGKLAHPRQEYESLITQAYEAGNDIAVHASGDGAVEIFMELIEKIHTPSLPGQFRLIHASLTAPHQWARLGKYHVLADVQPVFIPSIKITGPACLGARAQYMQAYKSMLKNGMLPTGGNDGPIGPSNPFIGIRYAVLREAGFGGEPLFPEECLSVYEAVCMYTKNSAYCAHEEGIKGTLEAGKLADFIVLDRDVFKIPAKEISDIKVKQTWLGGKNLFQD
ncbi:MAG: amidohydrolase [Treponema sp.]|jgi:predicted amidohydrolase YtcJ|nr:amidohydrolase [Treponema sp.]